MNNRKIAVKRFAQFPDYDPSNRVRATSKQLSPPKPPAPHDPKARIPYQKSYGTNEGFIGSIFQQYNEKSDTYKVNPHHGLQIVSAASESYGGHPDVVNRPEVVSTEFNHVPRSMLRNSRLFFRHGTHENRGPFVSSGLEDSVEKRLHYLEKNTAIAPVISSHNDGTRHNSRQQQQQQQQEEKPSPIMEPPSIKKEHISKENVEQFMGRMEREWKLHAMDIDGMRGVEGQIRAFVLKYDLSPTDEKNMKAALSLLLEQINYLKQHGNDSKDYVDDDDDDDDDIRSEYFNDNDDMSSEYYDMDGDDSKSGGDIQTYRYGAHNAAAETQSRKETLTALDEAGYSNTSSYMRAEDAARRSLDQKQEPESNWFADLVSGFLNKK